MCLHWFTTETRVSRLLALSAEVLGERRWEHHQHETVGPILTRSSPTAAHLNIRILMWRTVASNSSHFDSWVPFWETTQEIQEVNLIYGSYIQWLTVLQFQMQDLGHFVTTISYLDLLETRQIWFFATSARGLIGTSIRKGTKVKISYSLLLLCPKFILFPFVVHQSRQIS